MTQTATGSVRPKVLCVDDDPQVVAALEATLYRRFTVTTATSGSEGLRRLADDGPFAVVVSDFAMPGMNGAEFLARAHDAAPNTVRMLLTGQATIEGAIAAVNEGHVFRFLSKPCPPPVLLRALDDAVEQSRLVTADRALLEEKLESMSSHLVRAERLASVGTMAGAIGHELNNMLTVLMGTMGLLEQDVLEGTLPDREMLATLQQVQRQLATHARNLLELGRPAVAVAGQGSTDLRQAVADVLRMLRLAGILRNIQIRLDLPESPAPVPMALSVAQQVLLNLVKNAIDVFAERAVRGAALEIAIARDRDTGAVECRIVDNGGGIPDEAVGSVFDPYFSTKPPERGTGLGLFVVRHAMSEAGGRVGVASTPGRGTTFTLHFPPPGTKAAAATTRSCSSAA
ncbi:MAG: hybrid sensor histidine kinase/response regulator [Vicinamibacterales bacterium]